MSICRIATEGFQEVSSEVQTIEQALAEEGRNDLSQAVRRLQEKEKDKLQLVSKPMMRCYGDMEEGYT